MPWWPLVSGPPTSVPRGGCHGAAHLPTSLISTVVTADRQPVSRVVLPGGRPPGGSDRILPGVRVPGHARRQLFATWRARFLDAFVAQVGQRGLADTHVDDVCLLAGVSTGAFYKVFEGGKGTCAAQAFRCGSDIVCSSGESVFAQTSGPWEARLHAAVSAILDLLSSNPNFARLGIVEMARDPDGQQPFRDVVYRCRKAFGGPRQLEVPGISDVDVPTFETALVGQPLAHLNALFSRAGHVSCGAWRQRSRIRWHCRWLGMTVLSVRSFTPRTGRRRRSWSSARRRFKRRSFGMADAPG